MNQIRTRLIPIIQRYQAAISAQKAADEAESERKEQARVQAAAQQRAEYQAQVQATATEEQAERSRRQQLILNFMNSQNALAAQRMQMLAPKPTYNTNCYTAGSNTNCTTH
jgi:hypothetical protein